jgi:3-hydroxyisobutyrate dehydrogenase
MEIGWIGMGRMGFRMAERLLKAGYSVKVWNRTRSKAEPLAAQGAILVDRMDELRGVDVLFTMLGAGKDLKEICFSKDGVAPEGASKVPGIIVDCSTIGYEESKEVREKLTSRGVQYLAAPVSGNPQCIVAGKLSTVVSGPKGAYDKVQPLLAAYAVRGTSYVGEGDLARVCKLAHNVFLAVIIESLSEVTLLAQKAGIPRHAFLEFINNSPLGSIFSRYKSPALVNLDFTTTFTMALQRKDVDLGLEVARKLGVAMPVTVAVREVFQSHFGVATLQPDPEAYLAKDFSAVVETLALYSGLKLESENVHVPTGLEV